MHLKLNKYTYLFVALGLIIIAAILEFNLLKQHPENHLVEEFQSRLQKNEAILESRLEQINEAINPGSELDINETLNESALFIEDPGFGYLVFKNGILKFWSNRSMAFYPNLHEYKNTDGLLELPNGFYLAKKIVKEDIEILGLHILKNSYNFENKYLQNLFYSDYDLPDVFEISAVAKPGFEEYIVKDVRGDFLLNLVPGGQFICNIHQLYLPGIIYFLGLLLLLAFFRRVFVESKSPFFLKLAALGTSLFIVYWLHIIFSIPKLFFHLRFFGPEYFAISNWLPSLGDFFLVSLFFLYWLYNLGEGINLKELQKNSNLPRKFILTLLLLFNGGLFLLANYLIELLIFNSTISFSLDQITGITGQSVLGIFCVGIILFAVIFVLTRIIEEGKDEFKFWQLTGGVIIIGIFLAGVQFLAVGEIKLPVILLFILTSMLGCFFSKNYSNKYSLSYLILFVSVVSIYSLFVFYNTINQKDRDIQKLLAVNLVSERDPAAEEFLVDIYNRISEDPAIYSFLYQQNDLAEYIEKVYFSGYFKKYLFRLYVCGESDILIFEHENRDVPCLEFMDDLIQSEGFQIPKTDFYFMDNMNGRISYTGKIHFPVLDDKKGLTIYIDLDSDLLFEGIGFPELLIDKSMTRSDNYKKFDYAKYYGGDLTDKFGEYNYKFYVGTYLRDEDGQPLEKQEFMYRRWHDREHLIYHTRENNYVIVSRELHTIIDYLISFPYLFVFYFLNITIVLLIGSQTIRRRKVVVDLKFKIQAAIISIVFVSLLGVALATIIYNVDEYKAKHKNDLNEKMKSIAEEIDNRLEEKTEINDSTQMWLHRELAKLSNIFRTDINIYGDNGNLLSSSRSEIFDNGLISARMNTRAYNAILHNFEADYFETEDIGKLSYLSAYKPIINNFGTYLGVINLPYFIKQDNYSQEITTLVVAFINLYVLLFLASIIAAVFIANQITRPLVFIQENLQKMELGKHNEPIHYNSNDEIGSLVKEYNKKVDELAVSADLLARSERESAWREMAKQIAHEIKNPLTPMKLNIQHLQRTKGGNQENNDFLERVTETLIEQIDNLSNIATEFSNFAKIPTARNQVFYLDEQLKKVIDLYETHNRAQIEFESNGLENIEVNADREQLSRAIINLIKNGIQSVPEKQMGEIKIWLKKKKNKAIVAVKDNGIGIPVELREKLFSPSFTTKTSGMGLGLAIVKNIVENFSGKIWFETELGKGTTFFLEIPLYKKEEQSV